MPRVLLLTALCLLPSAMALGEDIPLESCDRLPAVRVSISGRSFLFLVDTAATSMLNLKSFAQGDSRRIAVTSWSGTVETHARQITVRDFSVGRHRISSLNLPAIDLSSIGSACGRRIDGILGVDLLSRLGATVDLKNRTAHLDSQPDDANTRIAELQNRLAACEQAFNNADEPVFADCLDPQIVLFAAGGDFYGREAAMEYYRKRYFRHQPRAFLTITPRGAHVIGDAIWVEYDLRIVMGQQIIVARGTALCEKSAGQWRIVHMNHSAPPPASFQAKNVN
jgi:SnoaL-like domain/Aspartyl protease